MKFKLLGILVVVLTCSGCPDEKQFIERLQPIPEESGFRMEGYWVWGGSAIKVGSTYHLFASRWPKKKKFPDDYFYESEIVRATATSPMGPFSFQEVVIAERDSLFWDSNMAHNPTIHKIGDEYVLFYIGSDHSTLRKGSNRLLRRVGYATAKNIEGPWERSENPVIAEESNNPALYIEENGNVKLIFRDEVLTVKIAEAPGFRGPYTIVNDNVWPQAPLEDFYLFKKDNNYHFICEDNIGEITGHVRWGAHFFSENGINNWKVFDPVIVYDHDIPVINGDTIHCNRRERPQLLIENNRITHLFNGVYDGENTWCQPVKLMPQLSVQQ